MKSAHCKICRRKLENEKSISLGIGPECAQKFAFMLCDAGLTLEALQIPEQFAADKNVGRFLHLAVQALLAGNLRDVERFRTATKEAAQRAERAALEIISWEEERKFYYGQPIEAAA